ncbi:MAG: transcription initiation factor IIB [Promethearchaeota archaeon]|jgi:transcription initiation factor TFIIB
MKSKLRLDHDFIACPECNGAIINSQERAELTCSNCGLIINERILNPSITDERCFSSEEKQKKARNGPLIHDFSSEFDLPTIIGEHYNDDQKRIFKHNSMATGIHRNLKAVFIQINRICTNLGLPETVKNEAKYLYIRASSKNIIKGHSKIGFVCACIYYASKETSCRRLIELSRQMNGLVKKSKNDIKHITKCYSILVRELELSPHVTNLRALIPRFVSELSLNKETTGLALKFLELCEDKTEFMGKNPNGIIASVIYLVCKTHSISITQKAVAEVADITGATLRNRIKDFKKMISMIS